jgi:hypothetical protein
MLRVGSNCPVCGSSLVPDLGEGWRLVGGATPVLGFRLTVRIVIKITSLGRDPRDDSQRFSRFPVQSPWR